MLWFLAHLVARRLLGVLAGGSSAGRLEMENAVLRHQLARSEAAAAQAP